MNKQRFTKVTKEYYNISEEDRQKLEELTKAYPYSQIIHALAAKANIDAGTSHAKGMLGIAAMYATDRTTLKNIIEYKPAVTRPGVIKERSPQPPISITKEPTLDVGKVKVDKSERITVNIVDEEGSNLRDEILDDLEALKKSKKSYMAELAAENVTKESQTTQKGTTAKKTTSKSPAKATVTKKTTASKMSNTKAKITSSKTKAAKTSAKKVTTASKKTTTSVAKKATASKAKGTSTRKTAAKSTKTTGSESSTSKKKARPQIKKANKTEQIRIIEEFINNQPSISSPPPQQPGSAQRDLSKKSTIFTADLISENLAQILEAQGRRKKAIEIYKKLIWKFPQKKSYFASRIEELKN